MRFRLKLAVRQENDRRQAEMKFCRMRVNLVQLLGETSVTKGWVVLGLHCLITSQGNIAH